VSIILGLILGSQLPLYAQKVAIDHFIVNYQPLVESIHKHLPNPCSPQVPYENQNRLDIQKDMGQLYHDGKHFILTFHGGSADIDGSTIYYHSKEGVFHIFHNDNKENADQLQKMLTGMTYCPER